MGFSLKKMFKSVGKAVNTVADVATAGSFSKVTGASSYANDLVSKVTGASLFDTVAGGATALFGLNALGFGNGQAGTPTDLLAGTSEGGSTFGMSGLFGNIVKGAVGLGQDYFNAKFNASMQQDLNDDAFRKNVEMWNLQNAYNDPSAQMARLERAGLNPNLIYGSGNVTGNTAGSAPQAESVKWSGVGDYMNRQAQQAQLELSMLEFGQRLENQAIQNDLARQRLVLAAQDNVRQNKLTNAQISAINNLNHYRDSDAKRSIQGYIIDLLRNGTGGETPDLF